MPKGWLLAISALVACSGTVFAQSETFVPPVPDSVADFPPATPAVEAEALTPSLTIVPLGPDRIALAPAATEMPTSETSPQVNSTTPAMGAYNLTNTSTPNYAYVRLDPYTWTSAEALFWWVQQTPLPPTLTTYAAGSPSATTGFGGALGVPGTSVLSPSQLGNNIFFGGRFGLGRWLDVNQTFGVEASGFFLAPQTTTFNVASNGSLPLRVPFINVPPGDGFPLGNSSFVLADPGFASGSQTIQNSLQLWGVEANGLWRLFNNNQQSVSLIGGFRYIDLEENMSVTSIENNFSFGRATGVDVFNTQNHFYGGQLGLKTKSRWRDFDGAMIAKVALGDNNQIVGINGYTSVTQNFGVPTGTYPGGAIFSQATNIGNHVRDQFCVVPEVQMQFGYNLTNRIRTFVGYSFLYMTNVVRPGNQIDSTLNFTSNAPISATTTPHLTGAARPEPLTTNTSFWAQGINAGLEVAF